MLASSMVDATLTLQRARRLGQTLGLMDDAASRLRVLALASDRLRNRDAAPAASATVPLRIRPLGGLTVHVRPRSHDLYLLWATMRLRWSAPPREIAARPIRRIADLGLNGGIDLAALAHANPRAELLGVEADAANVAVARRNVAAFGDRCRVVHAAAWDRAATLSIERRGRMTTGYVVTDAGAGPASERVPARTVAQLLGERWPDGGPIDFLYLDVEGAHARLFGSPDGWDRVHAVKVAGHAETAYSEADCARDLRRLGFLTRVIPGEPIGWTVGVRPPG